MNDNAGRKWVRTGGLCTLLALAGMLLLGSCVLLGKERAGTAGSLEQLSPEFLLGAVMTANRDWLYPPGEDFLGVAYRRTISMLTPEGGKTLHEEWVRYDRPFALSAPWRMRGIPFETTLDRDIGAQPDAVCEMTRTPEGNIHLSMGVPVFPDDPKDLVLDFPFDRYVTVADLVVEPNTLQILQVVGEDETLSCGDYLRVAPGRWVPRRVETSSGVLYHFRWLGNCLWFGSGVEYGAGQCPPSGYYDKQRGTIPEKYPDFQSWPVTITNDKVRVNAPPMRWRLAQRADVDSDPEMEEIAMPFWYPLPTYIGAELQPGDVVAIRPHDFGAGERDYNSNYGFGVRLADEDERSGFLYVGLRGPDGQVESIPVIAVDPVAADECLPDGSLRRRYAVETGTLRFQIERVTRLIDSNVAPTGKVFEETLSLVNGKQALEVEYWAENLECDDMGSVVDADGDGGYDTLACLNGNVAGAAPAIAKVYTKDRIELPPELNQVGPMGQRLLTVRQSVGQSVTPRETLVLSRAFYIVSNAKPPENCMQQVFDSAKALLKQLKSEG